jgi:hypothetical protein
VSKEIVIDLRHQQEGKYDGTPALWRLLSRKAQANPVGVSVFAAKNFGLEKNRRHEGS